MFSPRSRPFLAGLWLLVLVAIPARSEDRSAPGGDAAYVPQILLKLMHAPEVHRELRLTEQQVSKLEELFATIDGEWFRTRILPGEKQFEQIETLEEQVWEWLKQNLTADKVSRVRELVYRSQGTRMLFNPEVQHAVGLEQRQIVALRTAADKVREAEQQLMLAVQSHGKIDDLQKAVAAARLRENKLPSSLLSASQQSKIADLLGKDFDTRTLTRIYPMAPELVPVAEWINSQPITLRSLRGKVVLLHFYAFQCHNCHANFDKYIRWHEKYKDKGVVVLGIQTPETSRERDPVAVKAAADERNLDFPILIDLKSENWQAWGNTMWPTVYVIDQQGYLRYWWQGELNWQGAKGDEVIEKLVDELLSQKG